MEFLRCFRPYEWHKSPSAHLWLLSLQHLLRDANDRIFLYESKKFFDLTNLTKLSYVFFAAYLVTWLLWLFSDCTSEVVTYDLYAIICHHGTAGGGHYTAYCQNWSNHRWYEFDDQYVTEVSSETVAKCEAYVLFYKKTSPEMTARRQRTVELMQVSENK